MDAEEASFMTAQELMMVHIVSMALKAAMELGLIDALSAAPAGSGALTAAELAAQALPRPAANKAKAEDAVERILRFLTMAVLDDGVAFEMANNGMPPMVYMEKNPHLSGLFNKAMFQMSVLVCEKMLQCFTGFADDGIRTLVDVGGGGSTVLGMITSRYKHIKGIDFDMPFVIAKESQYQSVLHMMDDERCVKLLKNCYRSLAENGKVMAMDQVLPVEPEATQARRFPFMFDMICLVSDSKGGQERTEREFARLAMDAGFRGAVRSTPIFGGFWVLEFTK